MDWKEYKKENGVKLIYKTSSVNILLGKPFSLNYSHSPPLRWDKNYLLLGLMSRLALRRDSTG
jgi:hypothetical protein